MPPVPVVSSKPSRISDVRLSLVDGGSSSDNDASQAISAAINRAFESGGSDSELNTNGGATSHGKAGAAAGASGGLKSSSSTGAKVVLSPIQYTSSLLRDFVEKTQKLGQQQEANVIVPDPDTANSLPRESSATNCGVPAAINGVATSAAVVRKKRGRPPKKPPVPPAQNETQATAAAPAAQTKTDRLNSRLKLKLSMRDSPDSGILSVNQSPSHSPRTVKRPSTAASKSQSVQPNSMLLSLEKPIYPTERVLYPPRNVKRGRPAQNKSKEVRSQSVPQQEQAVDEDVERSGRGGEGGGQGVHPWWRKIDVNQKFNSWAVNGYKSDGGEMIGGGASAGGSRGGGGGEGSSAVCSKVLAAQCGYASDYGSVRKSRQSGYRSDYSTKSRKSGYRSDYTVKSGCGYRSDCSVRRKLRRKRRPKSSASGADPKGGDAVQRGLAGGSAYLGMRPKAAATFDEQDILQLAGLSLGNSSDDDSGNEVQVTSTSSTKNESPKAAAKTGVHLLNSLDSPIHLPPLTTE